MLGVGTKAVRDEPTQPSTPSSSARPSGCPSIRQSRSDISISTFTPSTTRMIKHTFGNLYLKFVIKGKQVFTREPLGKSSRDIFNCYGFPNHHPIWDKSSLVPNKGNSDSSAEWIEPNTQTFSPNISFFCLLEYGSFASNMFCSECAIYHRNDAIWCDDITSFGQVVSG